MPRGAGIGPDALAGLEAEAEDREDDPAEAQGDDELAIVECLRPAPATGRHSAAAPSKRRLQRRDTAATSWARLAASFP